MAEEAKKDEEWEEVQIEDQPETKVSNELGDIVEVIEEKEEPDPAPEPEPRYQKRINKLTAKQREEERRRQAVEAENQALRQRLEKLEQGADQQQINQFKNEYDRVKSDLTEATEEGDTQKQVQLTERMADMRAAARVAEQRQFQPQPQPQPQPQQQEEQPPQEAMRWWNDNRWFNGPDHARESGIARQIDQGLDAEGWDKETPEYYAELDNRLQKQIPELYSTPKKSKPPIAPTAGTSGSKGSGQPKDGRLRFTREQLDMAKSLGIATEEGLRAYHAEIQKGEG